LALTAFGLSPVLSAPRGTLSAIHFDGDIANAPVGLSALPTRTAVCSTSPLHAGAPVFVGHLDRYPTSGLEKRVLAPLAWDRGQQRYNRIGPRRLQQVFRQLRMRVAALVQVVLLALLTLLGVVGTVAVAVDWLRGLDTWFWDESTCAIESAEAVARPHYGDTEFQVSYRYSYRGEEHLGNAYRHGYHGSELASEARTLASRYPARSEVRCFIDPNEPDQSYLRRASLWDGFWILAPLVFVAVGAGSLWLLYGPERSPEQESADPRASSAKVRSGVAVGAMVVLPGIFFLFGVGFLIPFFVRPALQVVEARFWDEVPCTIVSSGVRTHPGEDGATYSIDVLFGYEIEGREYRANRYQFMGGSSSGYERRAKIVEALPAGTTTVCYVNPDDPFEAVIERGFTGDYLFGLVPLLFTLIGLGGLAFAVKALRSAKKDASLSSWPAATSPGVAPAFSWESRGPTDAASAGPLALEPTMGPVGKLGCTILAALFWNGFISIFVWQIVQSWRAGNPEWFVIIILTPFVLVGLLLLIGIPFSILALANPRPRVQLTPGALRAGESAQLEWAFRGAASRIRRLEISLAATETKTRQDASSVSIEGRPLDTPGITILERGRELPLEYGGVSFTLPSDTPPSSQGDVSIRWKLKLHGDIAYWPDVNEEFEVQVLPGKPS
ncbi:MAG: DUF3592 domain-containing protein, partial [Thermoanaerobaculia bacterium]